MAVTSMKLVDGVNELVLYPRADVVVLGYSKSSPGVRALTEPRPDDDGEIDTTTKYGAAAFSLELRAIDDPEALAEEMGGWMLPSGRPYIVVENDKWLQARRVRLRSSDWGDPVDAFQAPHIRDSQWQWRAPDGIWEADAELTVTVAADIPSSIGITYPVTYPVTYSATLATGAQTLVNPGKAPSHFRALLYGPCTAPSLVNDSTGQELTFKPDLALGPGEYIEVDTRNKTALLLSQATANRVGLLNFSISDWWQIQRGVQQIRYAPTDPSAGAQAVITYRPAWL